MSHRPTAQDAFIAKKAAIDTMLARLQALSAEQFNTDLGEVGDLLRAGGTGSSVELESVSLWNNDALFLVSALGGGSATIAYSSAASNSYASGANRVNSVAMHEAGATSSVFSSVFTDISGFSSGVFGNCVIGNDLSGLAGSRLTVGDPQFLNSSIGNLHLKPSSPAIDYCDGVARPPTRRDIDLDLRPIDSLANVDLHGPYDLGYDEFDPSALIFIDDFESGSTSACSATSP